jgi:hypothetical protein
MAFGGWSFLQLTSSSPNKGAKPRSRREKNEPSGWREAFI